MTDRPEARELAFGAIRAHLADRDALVQQVRDGLRRALDVLSDDHEPARSTRLLVVLEAEPGAQKVQTRRQLEALGVSEMALIGELTAPQRDSIVRTFTTARSAS